jgi:hypothetical protein
MARADTPKAIRHVAKVLVIFMSLVSFEGLLPLSVLLLLEAEQN